MFGLRRRRLGLDLALESEAISEVVVRGVVRACQERIKRCGVMRFALTDLDVRERAIGALRKIPMPEVDVPSHELANPLEAVTTVTVQIVMLLTGDQEFDSPKTLAAFALGLVLFLVTLALNIVALRVVRRYREQYE